MATIVRHNATGKNYCLLGTGFGAYQSKKPNMFLGNWMADIDEGQFAMACVCDSKGRVSWVQAEDITVVSIDGEDISSLPLA